MTSPWFALASYDRDGEIRPAIVLQERLFDLAEAAAALDVTIAADSVNALLADWDAVLPLLSAIAAGIASAGLAQVDAAPLAPFAPHRLFCTASNYVEHANEMNTALAAKVDSEPYIFLKSIDAVNDPGGDVVIPKQCTQIDWEVELGVVIGRGGHRISIENARDHIAGYIVFNDVSARDKIARTDYPFKHDWFGCKSYDGFAPIGPWLVPDICIPDPHALGLKLSVNDVQMQNGTSAEMIFNIYEVIAYLSAMGRLHPGDVIATGTPAGVGKSRGIYLKPGDVMHASVELIGTISNPVVAEA